MQLISKAWGWSCGIVSKPALLVSHMATSSCPYFMFLFPSSSLLVCLRKERHKGQVIGPLAFSWPSPVFCSHLGSEVLCFSFYNSNTQVVFILAMAKLHLSCKQIFFNITDENLLAVKYNYTLARMTNFALVKL